MPLQTGSAVENSFKNGLVTEATGLNFPESACTETYDCIFNFDGSVTRRPGFNFETGYVKKTINRTNNVVSTYLWRNVSGDGSVTLVVTQVGSTLYFYRLGTSGVSAGAVASTVDISVYITAGAPTTNTIECQFSQGNGLLFVTHPYCEPFYVSYNITTDVATATAITIMARDFEGDVADANAVDARPTSTLAALEAHHKYNLYNQGWTTTNLTTWDTARADMPSNSDVMWSFKNSSDAFDTATVANIVSGNSPAPKGHFITSAFNIDRDTAAGVSGATATTSGYFRPTTSAFSNGRVFFAGTSAAAYNSKIFFSQVVEATNQYGKCYQTNDPTAETLFDLLPTDGGVISIPDAGTIFKLFAVPQFLIVFAANGVWSISGSLAAGFTANDYTVSKISPIGSISATSFVDVAGFPVWWNADGIYQLGASGQDKNVPQVQSLSYGKIKKFYDTIPQRSKLNARGAYNYVSMTIQWLFRSTEASTPVQDYTFDRVLNINTLTGAFYPWTISNATASITSVVVVQGTAGVQTTDNVVDATVQNVIDASANQVVRFNVSGLTSATPVFKYFTAVINGSTFDFVFSEAFDATYLDWSSNLTPVDYNSYFVSGYKVRGQAIRKWQPVYIRIFSRNDTDTSYLIRGLWDYAGDIASARWSSQQLITESDSDFSSLSKRIKLRGHGLTLQFKVESVSGSSFDLIGWAEYSSSNTVP